MTSSWRLGRRLLRAWLLPLASLCLAAATFAAPPPCTAPAAPAPPSREEVQSAAAQARDRGFLWRLEKDGRTSWLYGTMHMGRQAWMFPGPRMRAALQQSDAIALELDLSDPATLAVFTEPGDPAAMARVMLPERRRRIDRLVAAACLPDGALARLRPILQVSTLAGMAVRGDGLFVDWSSEILLTVQARRLHKPVLALETAQGQLQALRGESEAEEAAQVDETLDALESGEARAQGLALATVWADSDWARLDSYRSWCDCQKTAADVRTLQRLLDDRHPAMVDGIAREHAQGRRVFAAVGALHMVGPNGLPALLAARGFTVTREVPAP